MPNATINLRLSLLLLTLLSSESTAAHHRSTKQTSAAVFIGECLYGQNAARASLGLPPLRWSTELAGYADRWLGRLRDGCAMIHSGGDYGENLFWGGGGGWTAAQAVAAWVAEAAYYNHWSNACMPNEDCSHYTQVVWRSTTLVGCAMVRCLNGDTLMACEYAPHGNVIGERPY